MQYTRKKIMHSRFPFTVIFVFLVVSSILFRFANLNWDHGNRIHPDEALIINGAMNVRFFSNLDTGFHDYNGLSVYALRAASQTISALTHNQSYVQTAEKMTVVGRYVSASISTISVILVYILALQFFSVPTALIAATLIAFSPLSIQLAHFYTTDSLLVALFVSLLLSITMYVRNHTMWNALWMAIPIGAACATKNTAYFFIPLPIFAILSAHQSLPKKISHTTSFVCLSAIVFFILSPHTFVDFSGYIQRSRYLQQVVSGNLLFDWTMQFQHTGPWYWFIQTVWAFGPLAVVGPIGLFLLLWFWTKHRLHQTFPLTLLSVWTIAFGIFLSLTYLKFIRYNAPLLLGYSIGFAYLYDKVRSKPRLRLLLQGVLGIQILYGVMFSSIYYSPHASLHAYAWITQNISPPSTILVEEWNSIIRFNKNSNRTIRSFNFYDPDTSLKNTKLTEALSQSDYIILESPKVKNTVTRLKNIYPDTAMFYSHLENGNLGFTEIATFSSYPHIGPLKLNDENAEETFTIFDHPTVRIYKKQRQLTQKELYLMLTSNIR